MDKSTPTAVGLLWAERAGGRVGIMSTVSNVEAQLNIKTAWI